MLCPERVLHSSKVIPEGRFGRIYQQPANADRQAALISLIKTKQNVLLSFRSINRHTHALSKDRGLLSPSSPELCIRKCFILLFTLRNLEDFGLPGRHIHLYVQQLCSELAFQQPSKPNMVNRPGACDNATMMAIYQLLNIIILQINTSKLKEYSV